MKIFNKFILSMLGSALIVGTGSAQNWTVNGTTQTTQLTTSASEAAVAIDPLTGVASIKTAGAGPSVAISANPSTVFVNGASTISWTASGFGNNLNCSRTSSPTLTGWTSSSNVATGSVSVTMPATAQTVTLTLSCSGDNGTASNFTTVAVNTNNNGVDCTSRPPNVFGSPRTLVRNTFFSIWNTDFPGIFGSSFGVAAPPIADGTVVAYSFVAPSNNTIEGYLQLAFSPDGGGRGTLAAGFSECEGEINNLQPTCDAGTFKLRNEWTTTGRVGACNLIPGRTYYYNMSIEGPCLQGPDPGVPGGLCSFRLNSRRYN